MAMKIELDLYTDELITELGDNAKSLFAGQIDQARLFGIPDQSLQVGAAAPNFFLPSATGEVIELRRLLQQGEPPMAGGWCRQARQVGREADRRKHRWSPRGVRSSTAAAPGARDAP